MKRICLLGILFSLQATSAELTSHNPWIRMTPPGATVTAGFVELRNKSDKDVEITAIKSDDFGTAEMHETKLVAGRMKMEKKSSLIVPAGGKLVLKPKGLHVMLFDAKKAGKEGEKTSLQLQYKDGTEQKIEFTYKKDAKTEEMKHHHHG